MLKGIRMKEVLSYTVVVILKSNLTTSAKICKIHALHSNNPISKICLIEIKAPEGKDTTHMGSLQ